MAYCQFNLNFKKSRTISVSLCIVFFYLSMNLQLANAADNYPLRAIFSETGKIFLSADGASFSDDDIASVSIKKPNADASINQAFLFLAANRTETTENTGFLKDISIDLEINAIPVRWKYNYFSTSTGIEPDVGSGSVPDSPNTYYCFFNMCAIVTNHLNTLNLNQELKSVQINKIDVEPRVDINGCALLVIFNDRSQELLRTVTIFINQSSIENQDRKHTFQVDISNYTKPASEQFIFNMGLGISNSCQPVSECYANSEKYIKEYSIIRVNDSFLSKIAGGHDDSSKNTEENPWPELITIGGIDDSSDNPNISTTIDSIYSPFHDDELYSLEPFINEDTTELIITTQNPSQNDNLFVAYVDYVHSLNSFDSDQDGVINEWDECENTHMFACTNNKGCDCRLKIFSNFEYGKDGWTGSQGSELIYQKDGYLEITDTQQKHYMFVSAPEKFLGDLTPFDNGLISFDASLINNSNPDNYTNSVPEFGKITISSTTGQSYFLDYIDTNPEQTNFSSFTIPLNASEWDIDEEKWRHLLSNVKSIEIILESIDYTVETIGFDNFMLQAKVCLSQTDIENIADKTAERERIKWDINGDGKYGLEDVIHYLEVLSGLSDIDTDGDGVIDSIDECNHTPPGLCKNNKGCLCDVYFSDDSPRCGTLDQLNQSIEQAVNEEKSEWDIFNDNKIGLPEVIKALKEIAKLDEITRTWYKDEDGDLYSDGTSSEQWDRPEDYYLSSELIKTTGDCNDQNSKINPGKKEIVDDVDNADENCDGHADISWYKDFDNDNYTPDYENPIIAAINHQPASSYRPHTEIVDYKIDCDDQNSKVNPGKKEIVDDVDNADENCDGHADISWYKDFDNDNYTPDYENPIIAAINHQPVSSYRPGTEIVDNKIDCDDQNSKINPGKE